MSPHCDHDLEDSILRLLAVSPWHNDDVLHPEFVGCLPAQRCTISQICWMSHPGTVIMYYVQSLSDVTLMMMYYIPSLLDVTSLLSDDVLHPDFVGCLVTSPAQ